MKKKKKRELNVKELNLKAILMSCNTKEVNTKKKRYYKLDTIYISR